MLVWGPCVTWPVTVEDGRLLRDFDSSDLRHSSRSPAYGCHGNKHLCLKSLWGISHGGAVEIWWQRETSTQLRHWWMWGAFSLLPPLPWCLDEMNMVGPNATQNLRPLTSIVCGVVIFLDWSTQTTGFTDWSDSWRLCLWTNMSEYAEHSITQQDLTGLLIIPQLWLFQ